jgi:Mg-chelatase subunit ChlD
MHACKSLKMQGNLCVEFYVLGDTLSLRSQGLRAPDGVEAEVQTGRRNALLLIDTSGSMAGSKIEQAKSGAIDFAHSATSKGYATALAIFADRTAMVCDSSIDAAHFTRKISG